MSTKAALMSDLISKRSIWSYLLRHSLWIQKKGGHLDLPLLHTDLLVCMLDFMQSRSGCSIPVEAEYHWISFLLGCKLLYHHRIEPESKLGVDWFRRNRILDKSYAKIYLNNEASYYDQPRRRYAHFPPSKQSIVRLLVFYFPRGLHLHVFLCLPMLYISVHVSFDQAATIIALHPKG